MYVSVWEVWVGAHIGAGYLELDLMKQPASAMSLTVTRPILQQREPAGSSIY